jgi:hypothetical protein
VAETWRIETSDTVYAVEVVRRGACWAVASDGDHAVLHSTPRIAVQAWALRNSVMGMILAPGEPTRAEAAAAEREDLARIGRLVGCDSLVGVEIHAAVEHVVRHELEAARDAAERAERERAIDCDLIARQAGILTAVADALKGPPPALSSHSHHDLGDVARRVVAERDDARAEVETLRAEAALLRSIIEGRAAPTRESFIALGATDGTVRYHRPDGGHGWFPASDPWWGAVVSLCREGARLWAHDADGRPCAWPMVTP